MKKDQLLKKSKKQGKGKDFLDKRISDNNANMIEESQVIKATTKEIGKILSEIFHLSFR